MSKGKKPSKLIIGNWKEGSFVPLAEQPPEQLTEIGDMVKWAKTALAEKPGSYDFVRAVEGQLTIGIQQKLNINFG